jgi:hypothetical protein
MLMVLIYWVKTKISQRKIRENLLRACKDVGIEVHLDAGKKIFLCLVAELQDKITI